MNQVSTLLLILALTVPACSSGKQGPQVDQGSLDKLVACQQERDRARTASEMCTKQLDEAAAQPASNELVVRLEGDILKIYGDQRAAGVTTEDATARSNAIISQVRLSRAAIQQCYVTALKKNEAIQARTINGKVLVKVSKTGAVNGATFSPTISGDFNACINKVATRWKVPTAASDATFEVPITLQPSE